ncbi:carbon-nitrogen hydrolase family protein [Mycolicibacterium sp. P9-64]|uniref:carbon-nitrogen hydrolase family protein n=1 Tax=Mycolicibacterium sp. P9-64 TaxID=2024612 RepID=UPI0011ED564A|nr:carbon-nitrogen hydrolase family protein [Mycolicibacterium sp. P9-64]KAA0079049.1 carbon-nitrogen hydrolase family protein [Mycolicibacterium sp. P9-64]
MVVCSVAQFAPGEDKSANLASIRRLVSEARSQGSELVVLPEYSMFTVAVMDQRFVASAEHLDGPFVAELTALAAQHGLAIVCGINEATDEGDRIHNTLLAISASGDVVATYRKLHLYDAFGYTESSLVRPGEIEHPQTFVVGDLRFGMQTCYDLRFPEVTRRLVDAEADVVLMPAEWVPGPLKEDHWTTLLRARAIENTVYLAAADQCGKAGAGNSMIVDPMGVVLASVGEEEGLGTAALDPDRIARVREKNPAIRLRRFSVTAKASVDVAER